MEKKNVEIKGYRIDFGNNSIVMNYKFAAAAEVYGSPEYELLKSIRADFPSFKVFTKAGRDIKTPRKTKRMTYANMEKYINTFANASELMEMFELVKDKSAIVKSPYKYVLDWFKMQFPNYKELPEKVEIKAPIVPVAAPKVQTYKSESEEKAS
ncbi:MAG: hypothetical protein E7417_00110 [Ruminococcaceae bacterium]|nr:hypothetical protein [Oscillospiraceae bacterium]